ncbi:MAG: glucokinase [Anaerolineales bacterium]|nr:glucokinase [Anaerolineales bacterium]
MREMILAGDIGGTKTSLALYERQAGPGLPLEKEVFASQAFESLEIIIHRYLANKPVRVHTATFGVAGPVKDGRVQTTTLPWTLMETSLRTTLNGAPVFLLNDLSAAAHAVPYLVEEDIHTLTPGSPEKLGTLGLVSPGTGLGEAFLTWNGDKYQVHPSEGGHTTFGPTTQEQAKMLGYLQPTFGHVSYERVCSGSGIPNLYTFLRDDQQLPEPAWLGEALATAPDPNPVIFQAAIEGCVELATRTLELFTEILANEAANLALKVMATGGIYLGGGIPPRLATWIKPDRFVKAFINKGRFTDWLSAIPIHIITRPDTALLGAACYGFEQEKRL